MKNLKRILAGLLLTGLLFTSCSKEENLPEPIEVVQTTQTTQTNEVITRKNIKFQVVGGSPQFNIVSYTSTGVLTYITNPISEIEYRLEEDEYFEIDAHIFTNTGETVSINVYIDGTYSTTYTENDTWLIYRYTNNHN